MSIDGPVFSSQQVGYAQPVLAALERLEQAGVEDEDVTLVSVVISKDALETLTEEAEDMKVVRLRHPHTIFPKQIHIIQCVGCNLQSK